MKRSLPNMTKIEEHDKRLMSPKHHTHLMKLQKLKPMEVSLSFFLCFSLFFFLFPFFTCLFVLYTCSLYFLNLIESTEDFEIEYGQDMGHFSPHSPPEPDRTHEDLEQNWNELQKKLQAQGRRVSLASENSENSENSEEEDEQKREFKEKRKHHYNEYQMMLRFRQQHEDQDEDEDEEHDG